jgi:hypothetical protein
MITENEILTLILTAKPRLVAEKKPLLPHPLNSAQPCGGRGCYLYGPEDMLNKNVSYTSIIMKIFNTFSVSVMQDLFPFSKMGLFKFHSRED